jgi:hypothetical protein
LLEAKLAGRDSIGVDNNGVATLVAQAKLLDYSLRDLKRLELFAEGLLKSSRRKFDLRGLRDLVGEYPNVDKWFNGDAIRDLAFLREEISALAARPRTLAMAVLSSLVVRASRQDSDTRYASVAREYKPGWAPRAFATRCKDAVARARDTRTAAKPSSHRVLTQDGRDLANIETASVHLLVTSPPYLNAYDYHKYHRHRLHWIGADVAHARDLEIGKHDTFTRKGATPQPYFDDMEKCLHEWHRVLKPGRRAVVVIGDSIVSGTFVPVANRLVSLARLVGFVLEERWLRSLDGGRKSFNRQSRVRREHVLLLRKGE